MIIRELVEVLGLEIACGQKRLEDKIDYAFASDLMSDVLTLDKPGVLLITGLANLQAIRTSEMADISAIIIARGKDISDEMINLAVDNNMILMTSKYSIFRIAGELYSAGLKPVY